MGASDRERSAAKKKQTAELRKAEKRKAEIDSLFMKIYEDWSARRITEYNFNMLSEKYQTEQQELNAKIQQLRSSMEADQQSAQDAEKWIELNRRSQTIQSLAARDPEDETTALLCQQVYDLARMAAQPLEAEEITAFLTRSQKLLGMLVK